MTMQAQLCQWHLGLDVVVEDSNVQMDNLDVVAAGSSMQVNHPGLDVVAAGSGGQQQLQEHTVIDEQPRNVVDELGAGSNQYTGKYLPAWLHEDKEFKAWEKDVLASHIISLDICVQPSGESEIDLERPSPSGVAIQQRIRTEGHPLPTEWRTPTPLHTDPFSYCSAF
eukprot:g8364.t1